MDDPRSAGSFLLDLLISSAPTLQQFPHSKDDEPVADHVTFVTLLNLGQVDLEA